MATYKSLKGQLIQVLTADPPAPVEGQVWVVAAPNSASTMKGYRLGAGAWSSGGNMPTNWSLQGSFGTRDATITGGGQYDPGSPGYSADSFTYNGTAWSDIAEINSLRSQSAGFGTATSGAIVGGYSNVSPAGNRDLVEEWNGTGWSERNDLPTTISGAGSAGVYTAALVFGGSIPGITGTNKSWDGTNWTEVGDLTVARQRSNGQSVGTQTAALMIGGIDPSRPGQEVESWNGSSWTVSNTLNTARELGGGNGIQTSAIAVSGRNPPGSHAVTVNCEQWDGTSWTEVANVAAGRSYTSSTGTGSGNSNTQSLFYGGATTSSTANTNATEEWNQALETISFDID